MNWNTSKLTFSSQLEKSFFSVIVRKPKFKKFWQEQ